MCVGGRGDECYLGKSQMSIDPVQRERERKERKKSLHKCEFIRGEIYDRT